MLKLFFKYISIDILGFSSCYICHGGYVFTCVFVVWIIQKLLNEFQRYLDGGWVSVQNRPN